MFFLHSWFTVECKNHLNRNLEKSRWERLSKWTKDLILLELIWFRYAGVINLYQITRWVRFTTSSVIARWTSKTVHRTVSFPDVLNNPTIYSCKKYNLKTYLILTKYNVWFNSFHMFSANVHQMRACSKLMKRNWIAAAEWGNKVFRDITFQITSSLDLFILSIMQVTTFLLLYKCDSL